MRSSRAVIMLFAPTAAVAVVSELLVTSVSETARDLGMTNLFVGVVIVALVGNAAEHFSAVVLAADDKMDAAIGIAVGSSTQIALFVAPALIFLSYVIAPQPMDLLFTTFELVAIASVGAEHRVHRARRRDELDGGRAAARGLHDPVAGVLLPAGIDHVLRATCYGATCQRAVCDVLCDVQPDSPCRRATGHVLTRTTSRGHRCGACDVGVHVAESRRRMSTSHVFARCT